MIVGVNKFTDGSNPPVVGLPDYSKLEGEQVRRLTAARTRRDAQAVKRSLDALGADAASYATAAGLRPELMPRIIDAVRARASVGEIADTLRAQWGEYRPT